MKKLFIALLLFFSFITQGQKISGKTYIAQTGSSCKEFFNGGGCEMKYYCYLEFKRNFVNVYYSTIFTCSPKEKESTYDNSLSEKKKCKWIKQGKTILIDGFDDYDMLKIVDGTLLGIKKNYKEEVTVEFKETICPKK